MTRRLISREHSAGHLHKIEGIMDSSNFKQMLIHHLVPSMEDLYPNGEGIFQRGRPNHRV